MNHLRKERGNWFQGKRLLLLGILISLFSFTGGIVLAKEGMISTIIGSKPKSDLEWAATQGLVSGKESRAQQVIQADFLKMLMTVYKPAHNGVIVPHGAENHWAASYYATAKNEGLIDCSCQIKPDQNVTYQEASKFVFHAINRKAGKDVVTLEEVQGWVKHSGEVNTPISYQEVVIFLHKMDDTIKGNLGEKGGR